MDRPHSNPSMATVAESVEALRQSANTKSPFNYFDINILVVDDDVTTLAIVSAMLRTWSYQVVSFKNPIDALATLRKKKCSFDIVVTDLHMPQMNGFELQKHVHEEFKLPVIMMSADDKESMILKGLEGGVADYIVKPVSKDDIRNVWRHAVAAKNGKSSNISIEEIESAPKESPGEVEDTSNSVTASDGEEKQDKFEFKVNKSRKRSRNLEEDHDDQPLIATKKSKVVWTNSLHNKFLLAIRHIGLEKAVPKRILEFMNVPGLTRENVASHLQKYRMFLKRVSERAKSSRCCLAQERVMRSRFASGHSPLVFRSLMPDHHHEYPQYQMGRPSSTIIQSGNSTPLALAANSNYNLGSSMNIQFPPPPSQQASFASSSSSMPRLINGSGQSRLLNNINQPMQLVGNGSYLLPQVPNRRAFGMQQRLNNVGNDGAGMPYGLVNGTNYGLTNGANLVPMYPQHAQAQGNQLQGLNFTTNPFSYNFATPGIQSTNYASTNIDNIGSSFNNVNQLAPSSSYLVSSNFAGTQMSSSGSRELVGLMGQPRLVNNYMNGGEYPNGLINSQINGLTNEVRNINLTSATVAPMGNITGINNSGNYMAQGVSSSSTGFDQTATYQFPRPAVFPTNNNIQQQNNALNQIGLPSNAGGGNIDNSYGGLMNSSSTTTTAPTLINNNISLEQQEFVGDNNDDDMMISNLFMHQINNYQPPPNYQQKGADGLHANLSSISYQAEAPKLTANQVLNPNPSVNQVVEPTVNGQVLQEPTANQVGNPGFSGSYRVQVNAPNQQSESQQQGGEQVFNQEFQGGNSVFQSEDYNHIFDQQDFDDDFMNAILGSGSGPY